MRWLLMCGLAGICFAKGYGREELAALVRGMAGTLAHRGPDDGGVWVDDAPGIALGFRRLAILDLGPTGHQPMLSADGRYVIVHNGEVYNYRDLRNELVSKGVAFRSTSDTEVILEAAASWGLESTVPRLWGMFAFAVWNREDRTLCLARDRIGKKPLYYCWTRAGFLFASELKALRACPEFDARVDRGSLAAYMRHGYVPAPYSIYEEVYKLPPASYAVLKDGGEMTIRRFWDARDIARSGSRNPLGLTGAEATEHLDLLLRDAVARRMIADVPLGALLSGGLDSSTVVALMQAQSSRPVRTFTIGFEEEGYDEAKHAKAVASHVGTEHTELYVTPQEARSVIPRLPELYDEPFADCSQIPTFLVCQLARRSVTVALSGDGGDELFGGYTRYLLAERIWSGMRSTPRFLRRPLASMLQGISTRTWDRLYQAAGAWIPSRWRQTLPGDKIHKLAILLTARDETELYRHLVSLWKTPEGLVLGGREPSSILTDVELSREFADFTPRMMLLDLVTYLPDDILVKVDRASMAVGLEARCPLLDHRVAEWAWQLPQGLKKRGGVGKWLLRQVLHRYVPAGLVERPKMGFGVPIDDWLRGPLRDWSEELLGDARLKREGFLKAELVRQAWKGHLSGRSNEQYRLWAVLMFQAWLQHVDRGQGSGPLVG